MLATGLREEGFSSPHSIGDSDLGLVGGGDL